MMVDALDKAPISGGVAVAALVGEVGHWPGVEVAEHSLGGTVFRLGRDELGHLREDVHGECVASLPAADRGRLSVPIRMISDLGGAVEVFRVSYERAAGRSPTQ
jgi:hypothetical protein